MSRYCSLIVALAMLSIGAIAKGEEPQKEKSASGGVLKVIPADVVGAIGIRNVAELRKRGDRLIDEVGLKVSMKLSDAYNFVVMFLGIRRGIDEDGPAALMACNTKFDEATLVLAVTVADLEAMAGNFKLKEDELAEGKVIDRSTREGKEVFPYARYVARHGRHLYLGGSEKNIQAAIQGQMLSEQLSERDRASLVKDDIVFYVSRKNLGAEWNSVLSEIDKGLQELEAENSAAIRQVASAVDDLQYAVAGLRLEDGVGSTVLLQFEGEKSREVLMLLQGTKTGATLSGLPLGRVLAAHASSGDGDASAALMRSLLLFGLPLDERLFLSSAHHPNIAGVFGAVWQRLEGSRSALYENANSQRHGQFSLVAILETEDAENFLADMTGLARFVNAATLAPDDPVAPIDAQTIGKLIKQLGDAEYRERELATTKLGLIGPPALPALKQAAESTDAEVQFRAERLFVQINKSLAAQREDLLKHDLLAQIKPNFAYFPHLETRAERPIDIVQIRLRDEESKYVPELRRLFGPQWNKLRLAQVDNQIVLLLGSETTRFEETIAKVSADQPGLKSDPKFARFQDRVPPHPTATFHLRLSQLQDKAKADKLDDYAKDSGITSLGITIAPQQLRLDLFAPLDEVKSVVAEFGGQFGF